VCAWTKEERETPVKLTKLQVDKLVSTLSRDELDVAADCILWQYGHKEEFVPLPQQLLYFLWEWLHHLSFTNIGQRRYLITHQQVRTLAIIASRAWRALSPISCARPLGSLQTISIADSRWFCAGAEKQLDLKYLRDRDEDGTVWACVTYITCDVMALLASKWRLADELGMLTEKAVGEDQKG
jgi:hypothetical protein